MSPRRMYWSAQGSKFNSMLIVVASKRERRLFLAQRVRRLGAMSRSAPKQTTHVLPRSRVGTPCQAMRAGVQTWEGDAGSRAVFAALKGFTMSSRVCLLLPGRVRLAQRCGRPAIEARRLTLLIDMLRSRVEAFKVRVQGSRPPARLHGMEPQSRRFPDRAARGPGRHFSWRLLWIFDCNCKVA